MDNRRNFLKSASIAVPGSIAAAFMATGCNTASNEVECAANIIGCLPANVIYSAANPGIWKGKAGSHAPAVSNGTIVTKHGMSPEHYIVRHSLVTLEGESVFTHTFAYDDKDAVSRFDITKVKAGKYLAFSFCNKHDLWVSEVTV